MFSFNLTPEVGKVTVKATENCGLPPEDWARRAAEHIVFISDDANEVIREQAHDFRERVYRSILHHMHRAIQCDRATVAGMLAKQGHNDMAEIIRRL